MSGSRGRGRGRRGRRGRVSTAVPIADHALPSASAVESEPHVNFVDAQTFVHIPRSKKRRINKESWKTRQRSHVPRPYVPCHCKKGCGELVGIQTINRIREEFFNLRDYDEQQKFITNFIQFKPSRLSQNLNKLIFSYVLPRPPNIQEASNAETTSMNVKVCVKQLMNTLSISVDRISKLRKEITTSVAEHGTFLSPVKDRRGRHNNRPRRISDEIRQKVDDYMHDVIVKLGSPSHYVRRHRRDTIYLSADLNFVQLYEGFHRVHDIERHPSWLEDVIRQRQDPSYPISVQPLIPYKWWLNQMNESYGYIRFWTPKTDQCEKCLEFQTSIQAKQMALQLSADGVRPQDVLDEQKIAEYTAYIEAIQTDFKEHQRLAKLGYDTIQRDYKEARDSFKPEYGDNERTLTIVSDFEQTRPTPNLHIKATYFKDQLSVQNLDFYAAHLRRHHFLLWPEWTARAGPNEMMSAFWYLKNELGESSTGKGKLIWWMDGCPVNKSQFTCGFAHELSDPSSRFFSFRRVDIKFPVTGHTFIEPDTAFSTIETKTKAMVINEPEAWVEAIRRCWRGGRAQFAIQMEQSSFNDWKTPLSQKYSILSKAVFGLGGEKIRFRDIRWANFGECGELSHPAEMWFKYTLDEDTPWKKINMMKSGVSPSRALEEPIRLYEEKLELDPIKMQTLHEYCNVLPPEVHQLYPPADPIKLAAAKRAQKAKVIARRNRSREIGQLDAALEELMQSSQIQQDI